MSLNHLLSFQRWQCFVCIPNEIKIPLNWHVRMPSELTSGLLQQRRPLGFLELCWASTGGAMGSTELAVSSQCGVNLLFLSFSAQGTCTEDAGALQRHWGHSSTGHTLSLSRAAFIGLWESRCEKICTHICDQEREGGQRVCVFVHKHTQQRVKGIYHWLQQENKDILSLPTTMPRFTGLEQG